MTKHPEHELNICFLSLGISPESGSGRLTHELTGELWRQHDIQFDVYLPQDAAIPANLPFKDRIYCILPSWTAALGCNPVRIKNLLYPAIRKPYDIIHVLVEFPYAITAHHLARKLNCPYIVGTQGTYAVLAFELAKKHPLRYWLDVRLYRQALKQANLITAPSSFTANVISEKAGISQSATIIHNPVRYEIFQESRNSNQILEKYGLSSNTPFILSVGELKGRKGLDILLRAFKAVIEHFPEVQLVIVGDGNEKQSLLQQAEDLSIANNVIMTGVISDEDLFSLYQTCFLYAMFPRYSGGRFEGFGLVYLEAGANGKPVVASNSGGVPDAVIHNKTGLIVDENNADEAADAMLKLLRNPELAKQLGQGGKKYAADHSIRQYADVFMKYYVQLKDTPFNFKNTIDCVKPSPLIDS